MPHFKLGDHVVVAEQWTVGKEIKGVRKVPATKVDCTKTRGIIIERPERYVAETSLGSCEMADGDWIVTFPTGLIVHFRSQIFALVEVPADGEASGCVAYAKSSQTGKKQGLPSILSRLLGKGGR